MRRIALRRVALPGLLAVLALAACGTRLPDKDFVAGQQQVVTGPGGVTSTTGPNGVVPTVSGGLPGVGPSAGSSTGANGKAGGSIAPPPRQTPPPPRVTARPPTP